MAAYIIVDVTIHDPSRYDEYKGMAAAAVAAYGGKYIARGGATQTLEGDWQPNRLVLLEFPSKERAHEWWDSEQYRPARDLRQTMATTQMVLVEGT